MYSYNSYPKNNNNYDIGATRNNVNKLSLDITSCLQE